MHVYRVDIKFKIVFITFNNTVLSRNVCKFSWRKKEMQIKRQLRNKHKSS